MSEILSTMDRGKDAIKHFGVKGMKWGVRKDDVKSRTRGSNDHEDSRVLKKTALRDMSNSELRRLNERLQLERTNNELQSRNGLSKIKKGTAIAGAILAVPTTMATAYNIYQGPLGKAVRELIKK